MILEQARELATDPKLVAVAVLAVVVAGLIGQVAYRLFLSPIANFPGPRLAALSRWYEAYYEILLKGKYEFKIQQWHDQYGPIIRVSPDELHIRDSDYWDELFSKNLQVDRYDLEEKRFGNSNSVFSTPSAAVHRRRRAALNPMFSRQQVLKLEPLVKEKVNAFCAQLEKYKESGKPVRFDHAFAAFAGDVIVEYAFGFCYNQIDSPDFSASFHDAYMIAGEMGGLAVQFPIIHTLTESLPDAWVAKMNPALSSLFKLRRDLADMYKDITSGSNKFIKDKDKPTVFSEVLNGKLPDADKACIRIVDESQAVIAGGVITTAWAASHFAYHVVSNPTVYRKLTTELTAAIPNPAEIPSILTMEKLPYLRGCIQESLRLSYGLTHRQTRVHRNRTLKYKDWVIPAGTPVGMTIMDVHDDETVFPESARFVPERWMNGGRAPHNGLPLEHYLMCFGKGTRACLGINLAYQELFLMLGTVFRRFEFELYDTDASDVKLAHDFFMPSPKLDTKGVRMVIKKVNK